MLTHCNTPSNGLRIEENVKTRKNEWERHWRNRYVNVACISLIWSEKDLINPYVRLNKQSVHWPSYIFEISSFLFEWKLRFKCVTIATTKTILDFPLKIIQKTLTIKFLIRKEQPAGKISRNRTREEMICSKFVWNKVTQTVFSHNCKLTTHNMPFKRRLSVFSSLVRCINRKKNQYIYLIYAIFVAVAQYVAVLAIYNETGSTYSVWSN